MRYSVISVSCLAVIFGAAGQASAGGFFSPYQSATAIGTAFAGASARSDDAGFFLYNPATISDLNSFQTFSDVRGFAPRARIVPANARSPAGTDVTADGASGNLTSLAIAPGSVTVVPLGNGLTAGFGTSAPFATATETRPQWAGRFHLQSAWMVGMNATGAVSWKPVPGIAIAGGIQVERFETRFENTVLIPVSPANAIEAKAFMKGVDWGAGGVAGVLLKPAAGTRIGLSWRSGMSHGIDGTVGAKFAGIPAEGANYSIDLPQTVSAGLEQQLTPNLRVFAEVQWTDWSRFKGFNISFPSGRPNEVRPIDWQDTWLVGLGIGYRITPVTELTVGVSYDTAASVTGSGTTLSPDANKLMVGLGAITNINGIGRVSLSYGHVFAQDAPVNANNTSSGLLEGKLEGSLDVIALGVTHEW